jgi:Pectinesterase/Immunoglobulin domain/Bacterial Ig-like domain
MFPNRVKLLVMLLALAPAGNLEAALNATNLWPASGATNVCPDTPLRITFDSPPVLNNTGKIRIYTAAGTLVDTLDLTLNVTNPAGLAGSVTYAVNVQPRTIAGTTYTNFPVIISGDTAFIYPHLGLVTTNLTYYVNVDAGVFSNGGSGTFAGILDATTWRFSTKTRLPATTTTNLVVAADGTGDFCTVQGVLDFLPSGNTVPRLINLRNGLYQEIVCVNSKHSLTFRGQDRQQTVIAYPNNNNLNNGSSARVMWFGKGNDLSFDNLTLSNSTPHGGSQAEAVRVYDARAIFNNCDLCSYQDTILVNSAGNTAYFYNCRIQGDTDYSWGVGTAYFTNCQMVTMTSGGYNSMPRTGSGANGFAWVNCQILGASTNVTGQFLARTGGDSYSYGQAVYINCALDTNVVSPAGWYANGLTLTNNIRFWEYHSVDLTGHLVDTSQRVPWSRQIDAATAATVQNASSWLGGWAPQLSVNITRQPTNQTVAAGQTAVFTVGATGIPDPTYQWRFNGTNIAGATNATFSLPGVQATNAAAYSVVVSNSSGAVTSSNAVLAVGPSLSPSLGSLSWSNGLFGFAFNGGSGTNYAVQASSNLTQWQTVFSTSSPALPFVWTDSNALACPARYYRVQIN